ncbi:hypothetical protein Taro_006667 [Colocasia esculenta]|uniref:3-ketoacyl-CoA synthase n=1 Tax=Colocasia esculenta TaxID=4460 RepID=A0A843TXP7_COLES|nr:hypothetical protein [Colocasia esculenta]
MDGTHQLTVTALIQSLASLTSAHLLALMSTTTLVLLWFSISNRSACRLYLVDFRCSRLPASLRTPISSFIEHSWLCTGGKESVVDFCVKVLERSGIGGETSTPESIHELPPDMSLNAMRVELETVLFPTVADLLAANKVSPGDIDVVVSNCSLSCPTPSISAMLVNRFRLRSDVLSYSLSGMGCSAGLLAVDLVRDMMRVRRELMALVVSMEVVGHNGYPGTDKSMLLPNFLFRMGGAALLLSNRKRHRRGSKYVLQHLVRTHLGQDDRAYRSVYQEVDEDGAVGVSLSRALVRDAGRAVRTNIAALGPLVLPYSEQARYAWWIARRRLFPSTSAIPGEAAAAGGIYVPNFRLGFEHLCVHAGGRAVIEAMEERLKLRPEDVEASKMTLYRFGNTSSSSVWYELSYLEAKGRVRRGDRVWQIGFGSGFKCNSAVWRCVDGAAVSPRPGNVWRGIIHQYPVDVPEVLDH